MIENSRVNKTESSQKHHNHTATNPFDPDPVGIVHPIPDSRRDLTYFIVWPEKKTRNPINRTSSDILERRRDITDFGIFYRLSGFFSGGGCGAGPLPFEAFELLFPCPLRTSPLVFEDVVRPIAD